MNRRLACVLVFLFLVSGFILHPCRAQVPQIINYQGRVVVNGTNYNGTGQFQFALVNGSGKGKLRRVPRAAEKGNDS